MNIDMFDVCMTLFVILMLLQGADAWSTNRVLAAGGKELNAVEAWFQKTMGALWFVPKVLLMAIVGGIAAYFDFWPALLVMDMAFTGVVINNILQKV